MVDEDEIAHTVLQPHFDAVRDEFAAFEVAPGVPLGRLRRVRYVITSEARSSERHFAATLDTGMSMIFAPQIVDLPVETLVAILAHEFGHAADFAYPACWTWPKNAPGAAMWVGESDHARAAAWRFTFGKAGAKSRSGGDDKAPSENWAFAWHRRNRDQIEWAADAIATAVTGQAIGYCGPCMLQCFHGGMARPAGLR